VLLLGILVLGHIKMWHIWCALPFVPELSQRHCTGEGGREGGAQHIEEGLPTINHHK